VLAGGTGVDVMTGGLGADVFVLLPFDGSTSANFDTIKDFVSGTDHISLGDYHLADGAGLIGTHAFSGAAGELRYTVAGTALKVELDVNGDGVADLTFLMVKTLTLISSDFL
jgi:serralysin